MCQGSAKPCEPSKVLGSLPSPGSAHRGTRLARSPCDTQRPAGQRRSRRNAGDCDLPFVICKGLGEKGWLWFLAVHNSQMSRLSGVFAQSSGCTALQDQAQEELLLLFEGRPKLFRHPPSIITAIVTGKLSLPQSSQEALPSGCCSLCSAPFMLAKDLPWGCAELSLGGGLIISYVINCDLHTPRLNSPSEQNRNMFLLSQTGVYS